MEDTRCAIRQGRALAAQGLYKHAIDTWKAALSSAYSLQDYAGMFVLSGNIGEAYVRIATQSKCSSTNALALLRDGKESLDYALQLVEMCSLRETLGGYRALYQGVRRAEKLRMKAEKLALQQIDGERTASREKEIVGRCSTCGVVEGETVLDENDGCHYCRKCYDEYYAVKAGGGEAGVVAADDVAGVEEELIAVQAVDELGEGKEILLDVGLCQDDEGGNAGADLVVPESNPPAEPVNVAPVDSEDEQTEEIDREKAEKAALDRIRYERVELGSLADFLAGKLQVEDQVEQPDIQQNDVSSDILVPVPVDISQEQESSEESIATIDAQQVRCEAGPATSDERVVREEEAWSLDEDTTETNADKREYSIAQLLEIRKHSPSECPETLLASPVRDDGSAPTPARNKANNVRKKSNAKKITRSAASHRQNRADAAGSNQSQTPEKTDATRSISLLPTLDLCNALRQALQEERQTDGGASCDNSIVSDTTEALLFDSLGVLPFAAHVRLLM